MEERLYYAQRKGVVKEERIDFELLKKLFGNFYQGLKDKLYFLNATGYNCVDGRDRNGEWGRDVDIFIYSKTKLKNVWPIEKCLKYYDQDTLFTIIEFLYDYVAEPKNQWFHEWDNCGWHCTDYNRENGKSKFYNEINKMLNIYEKGYRLTKEGQVQIISPLSLENLIDQPIKTDKPENIDDRIKYSISKYLKFNSTINDKKEAVRTLADVLEYLKKDGIRLDIKDDSDLFNIINGFDIRHHNKLQQSQYDKEIWYEWMFYSFLSSINILLKIKVDNKF